MVMGQKSLSSREEKDRALRVIASPDLSGRGNLCSARLLLAVRLRQASQPRAGEGPHDLKRSHYNCVWNLANEIATLLSGDRNDKGDGGLDPCPWWARGELRPYD